MAPKSLSLSLSLERLPRVLVDRLSSCQHLGSLNLLGGV